MFFANNIYGGVYRFFVIENICVRNHFECHKSEISNSPHVIVKAFCEFEFKQCKKFMWTNNNIQILRQCFSFQIWTEKNGNRRNFISFAISYSLAILEHLRETPPIISLEGKNYEPIFFSHFLRKYRENENVGAGPLQRIYFTLKRLIMNINIAPPRKRAEFFAEYLSSRN